MRIGHEPEISIEEGHFEDELTSLILPKNDAFDLFLSLDFILCFIIIVINLYAFRFGWQSGFSHDKSPLSPLLVVDDEIDIVDHLLVVDPTGVLALLDVVHQLPP